MLVNDKKIQPIRQEHPLALHLTWGEESGKKYKFLFKQNTTSKEKAIESRSAGWTTPTTRKEDAKRAFKSPLITKKSFGSVPKMAKISDSPPDVRVLDGKSQSMETLSPVVPPEVKEPEPTKEEPVIETLDHFVPQQGIRLSMLMGIQEQKTNTNSTTKSPQKSAADIQMRFQEHQETLIKWVNSKLPPETTVQNLNSDFRSGVILCLLLEKVSGKPLKKMWHKNPKNILHQLDNLGIVLEMLKQYGINLVGVNAEDICGTNNENYVMLILAALIKKFQSRKNLTSSMSSLILAQESSTFKKFHMKGDIIHEEHEESPQESPEEDNNDSNSSIDVTLPTVEIAQIILSRLTTRPQVIVQKDTSPPVLSPASVNPRLNQTTDGKRQNFARTASLSAIEDMIAQKPRVSSVATLPSSESSSPDINSQWERKHKQTSPELERTSFITKKDKIVLGNRTKPSGSRSPEFIRANPRKGITRSSTSREQEQKDEVLEIDLSITFPGIDKPQSNINQSCRQLFGELDDLLGDLMGELNS